MSITRTNSSRQLDHFQPEDSDDPQVQKRRRAHLEQIDYAAYAANKEVLAHMLGTADAAHFQRLAVSAAHARGQWLGEALRLSHSPAISPAEGAKLAALRALYDELTEAYEGLRRLVERGHIHYRTPSH
jgi:hypothetical protein